MTTHRFSLTSGASCQPLLHYLYLQDTIQYFRLQQKYLNIIGSQMTYDLLDNRKLEKGNRCCKPNKYYLLKVNLGQRYIVLLKNPHVQTHNDKQSMYCHLSIVCFLKRSF